MASEEESMIQVNEDYGFKHNLRLKIMDMVRRIELLEKAGIMYSVTIRSMIVFAFAFGVGFAIDFFAIINNGTRAKFIAAPLIILTALILLIIAQMCLIMPSHGSLFMSGITLAQHYFKQIMIKTGRYHIPNETMVHDVTDEGVILFYNGDYGVMALIDGMTSASAYPSEIRRQEMVASQYHNGRKKSTAEIHITSSQKQNTERQLENLENNMEVNKDPASQALMKMEYGYMKNRINGVKPTIVQYILFRNQSEKILNESLERFDDFAHNRNMYYDATLLTKDEIEKVLGNIYAFK
ncbi:hypothetical protein ACR56S_03995 [Staphylococcus hominis]|uniref:hypothetical protein n=1 Tax=Staphylococcus hominis TaxID=1290 RepID=UPI003DA10414